MRALVVFIWSLAVVLMLVIVWSWQSASTVPARAAPAAPLELWRPPEQQAQPVPGAAVPPGALPGAAVLAPAAGLTVPPKAGCSRLGLFPDAGWAESVARRLDLPVPAGNQSEWHLQAVGERGYYLVLPGVSGDALAARLLERRAELGRLVSRTVRPEPCVSLAE